jgi:hypothetical protein
MPQPPASQSRRPKLREVLVPYLNRTVKLGRLKPKARPRLHLKDYLRLGDLPPPPPTVDWSPNAAAALAQMYNNDVWGDCVIAGLMHLIGVWTGNATGKPFIASLAQVTAAYSAIGGFDPNNPQATDNGCDEATALQYAASTGIGDGVKFVGSIAIDATNKTEVMQTLNLFEGGVMFGMALPDAWVQSLPSASGFVWDVAGDPDQGNGHCVIGVGYTEQGVIISTWGMLGTITWAAVAKYAVGTAGGELWAALSPDQIAAGQAKAPNGIAWADLQSDLAAIAGQAPAPAQAPSSSAKPAAAPAPVPPKPSPAPAPTPAPKATAASSPLLGNRRADSPPPAAPVVLSPQPTPGAPPVRNDLPGNTRVGKQEAKPSASSPSKAQ